MKVGQREPNVIPGFGITLGFTTFFLCAIVLIPLAALVLKAGGMDWERFVSVIASPRALASYRLSFGASLVAATVNMVFGFAIAWTLTRDFLGSTLIGVTTPEQLDPILAAADAKLPPDALAAVDAVSKEIRYPLG